MRGDSKFLEHLPMWRDRPLLALATTLVLVLASLLVRLAVDHVLPAGFPFVTFFPAVVISAFLFGVRNGTIAAVLCAVAAWWFFIAPATHYAINAGGVAALALYVFVVATELAIVGWMQRAHAELVVERARCEALAQSRELMFAELQHRVSNNLQVVGSLLALQRRQITDPQALAAIDEATRRLSVIGRISRALYDPDGAALGLDRLLSRLCDDVLDASGRSDISIAVTSAGAPTVEPDAAIPVALIVAESVANAIEHGFAQGRTGRIDVHVARTGQDIDVTIADNGHGLPADFDLDQADSLGLKIARLLARQLNGSFSIAGVKGTTARLSFAAAPL
jgi:two-component sensor histidine kinase